MTPLANDYSRCVGQTDWATKAIGQPERLVAPCIACRRREPGHPTRQVYVAPAVDEQGACMHRIAPLEPV